MPNYFASILYARFNFKKKSFLKVILEVTALYTRLFLKIIKKFVKKKRAKQNANTFNISVNRTIRNSYNESRVVSAVQTFPERFFRDSVQTLLCYGFLSVCYGTKIITFEVLLDFGNKCQVTTIRGLEKNGDGSIQQSGMSPLVVIVEDTLLKISCQTMMTLFLNRNSR